MASLSGYCIHTFRHSDDLRKQLQEGGRHTLTERQAWTTGRQLWAPWHLDWAIKRSRV